MEGKWCGRRVRVASLIAAVVGVFGTTLPSFAATGDSAGCPTAESFASPVNGFIEIDTPGKLQMLRDSSSSSAAMSAKYKLTENINLSGCTWAGGISLSTAMFSGEFDGNSKTISNVTVIPTSTQLPDQGFFRYLSGSVYDLTMSSLTVTATAAGSTALRTGGLAGSVREGGSVRNVTLSSINITGGDYVGGAFGETLNNTTVQDVSLSGSVAGRGLAGGLVGDSQSTITGITSSVDVNASQSIAGGLVANLRAGKSITNSSVTGNVTVTINTAGGIVGTAGGNTGQPCAVITSVRSSGQVSAASSAGGIAGSATCLTLDRSSSSSVITATGARAGGLIGASTTTPAGTISKSFFTGQVQGSSNVGGLVGFAFGPITDSYSTGSVTATSTTGKVGGLVGEVYDASVVLTRVYATGAVTGPASVAGIGGLIGRDTMSAAVITSGLWDKGSTGQATSANSSAKGFTTQQLRDFVLYDADNLNWSITDGISSGDGVTTGTTWSICSGVNSGYPFLTRQGLSGTCLPTMAYNENNATTGSAPLDPTTPYTPGSTVTVLGNTGSLSRTGFVFDGWNTKANGTGTNYSAADTFTLTSPVMLFAKWTAAPSLSYNVNSGTGSIAPLNARAGSSVTLSSGSGVTRTGYTLSRWDTRADGLGTSYALGATITMPATNTTLYAIWALNRVMSYNSNGGSGSVSSLTAGVGLSVTLSSGSGFTRTGYTLSRWDTRADGLGTSYALGATITMPATNTTLYAVWVADSSSTSSTTSTSTSTTIASSVTTTSAAVSTNTTAPSSQSASSVTTTTIVRSATTVQTATTVRAPLSPTSTTKPLVPTTTAPQSEPAPDLPRVIPGGTGATVDGNPVKTTVTNDDGDLVISIDDATLRFSMTTSNGEKKPIPVSGIVDVRPGSTVSVGLSGLGNNAKSGMWVLPSGRLLGEVDLKNGAGSLTGVIPKDAPAGDSRFVVESETAGGKLLVVAYGVQIAEADSPGRSWSAALFIIVGLAVVSALFIPAARRRNEEEEEAS